MPTFADEMKKKVYCLVAGMMVLAWNGCGGKKQEPVVPASISWLTETEHQFGTYHSRDTLACDFVYRNDGPGNFIIERLSEPVTSATR